MNAEGDGEAVRREQSTELVGESGALADQGCARSMQRQDGLLLGGLDRGETHRGPGDGLADGHGVVGIVLVALAGGRDESRCHEPHLVAERAQLAGPVMTGWARVHPDEHRRRKLSEELANTSPAPSLGQHRLLVLVDPEELEHVFPEVDTDSHHVHLGPSVERSLNWRSYYPSRLRRREGRAHTIWYTPRRRHSALDYLSPILFERGHGADDRPGASGSTIVPRGAISLSPSVVGQ